MPAGIKRKGFFMSEGKNIKFNLELFTVILLGITAVATGWSSWQGSMHGSLQSQKYTNATRLTAEASALYNEASSLMSQDMNIWNQIISMRLDYAFAEMTDNADEMERLEYKLAVIMADNVYEEFEKAIDWADDQEEYASPFDNEDFLEHYFVDASELFEEAEAMMAAGDENSTHGDNQGLVSVIYAVVLFMLGIVAPFKEERTKRILLVISVVGFIAATGFMLTIPAVFP